MKYHMYDLFIQELGNYNKISEFTHENQNNISGCGAIIEVCFRKFLSEILGDRFRITHGYIALKGMQKYSPQIDIIITDTLVPHRFKKFEYLDGMEIVPVESVVGIFEVKRTLNKKTFLQAKKQIQKIIQNTEIQKNRSERYLPGGVLVGTGIQGGNYANPFIGIISYNMSSHFSKQINPNEIPKYIDCIFNLSGHLIAPYNQQQPNSPYCHTLRKENLNIEFKNWISPTSNTQYVCLQLFVAYLMKYLSETSGRIFDVNDYFLIKYTNNP